MLGKLFNGADIDPVWFPGHGSFAPALSDRYVSSIPACVPAASGRGFTSILPFLSRTG